MTLHELNRFCIKWGCYAEINADENIACVYFDDGVFCNKFSLEDE